MNAWSYTSTSPYAFRRGAQLKAQGKLYFTLLNSGNACFYSVQSLPVSTLNIKKTAILTIALPGYKTGSITLRGKHKLREYARVVRTISGP
jgi:hypothetical protein